eukprot:g27582.t1
MAPEAQAKLSVPRFATVDVTSDLEDLPPEDAARAVAVQGLAAATEVALRNLAEDGSGAESLGALDAGQGNIDKAAAKFCSGIQWNMTYCLLRGAGA